MCNEIVQFSVSRSFENCAVLDIFLSLFWVFFFSLLHFSSLLILPDWVSYRERLLDVCK